jgi:hypothetical protein
MSPLTIYLARLFGLGMLVMCALFAVRPEAALAAIQSMAADPGLVLMAGLFAFVAGLAMVIGHNRWSGGVLTVVVTLLGWLTLIKGVAILAAPPPALAGFYGFMGYPGSFRGVMAVAALASLWLSWAAFRAKPAPTT